MDDTQRVLQFLKDRPGVPFRPVTIAAEIGLSTQRTAKLCYRLSGSESGYRVRIKRQRWRAGNHTLYWYEPHTQEGTNDRDNDEEPPAHA